MKWQALLMPESQTKNKKNKKWLVKRSPKAEAKGERFT
jgi:hypothetical protein